MALSRQNVLYSQVFGKQNAERAQVKTRDYSVSDTLPTNIAYKHLLKSICMPWAAEPNLKNNWLANLVGCVLHVCNKFDTLKRFNEVKMCLTRPAQRNRCLISDISKTECLYNYTMEHDVSSYDHFSGFRNTTVSSPYNAAEPITDVKWKCFRLKLRI